MVNITNDFLVGYYVSPEDTETRSLPLVLIIGIPVAIYTIVSVYTKSELHNVD